MSFKIKGKVTHQLGVKQGESAKGAWANCSFVVEEVGVEYPQSVVLSYFKNGEYATMASGFESKAPVGSMVDVEFNMKAKEYNGKYYPENSVWKVEILNAASVAAGGFKIDDEDNQLPF